MKKGIYLYILILSLVSGNILAQTVWDGRTDENWPEDTTQNEYTISTPAQLARLARLVNDSVFSFEGKTITLLSDIDLNYIPWEPIGRMEYSGVPPFSYIKKPFCGRFNGNGKTIHNLIIEAKHPTSGLFGYIENGARIENVTLQTGKVYETGLAVKDDYPHCLLTTAALVGYVNSTASTVNSSKKDSVIIRNCHNAGVEVNSDLSDINQLSASCKSYTSGLVGYVTDIVASPADKPGNILFLMENCSNDASVSGTYYTAGIIGGMDNVSNVIIRDNINKGTLFAGKYAVTGGIIADVHIETSGNNRRNSLAIESCVNTGDIDVYSEGTVGGILGKITTENYNFSENKVTATFLLSDCYFASTLYASPYNKIGGLIGELAVKNEVSSFIPVEIKISNNYVTGSFEVEGDATIGGLVGVMDLIDYSSEASIINKKPCRIHNNLVVLTDMPDFYNSYRIAGILKASESYKIPLSENYAYIDGHTWTTEIAHYKQNGEDWKGSMHSMPFADWNNEGKIAWDFDPTDEFMPKLANVSFEQPDIPNPLYGKRSTGIMPVEERPFSYSTSGNGLYIETNTPGNLSVYKFSGNLYTKRFIPAGLTTIQMPTDLYIVNFNGFSEKVVINR